MALGRARFLRAQMPRQDVYGRWISDDGALYWDGRAWQPVTAVTYQPTQPAAAAPGSAKGGIALGLGIASLLFWLLPILGLPISIAAVVEAVGPGVKSVKPGDHCIIVFWPNCGRCEYCQMGRPMLCNGHPRPPGTMLDGSTRLSKQGQPVHHMAAVACFAEHAVIHEEQLLVIDDSVPLDRAALVGCSVTTGVGAALNTARVRAGSSVAVIGCGGVGLSVIPGPRIPDLYRQGRLQLDALLTRHYPLERINEAYADLQGSQAGRGVISFG